MADVFKNPGNISQVLPTGHTRAVDRRQRPAGRDKDRDARQQRQPRKDDSHKVDEYA